MIDYSGEHEKEENRNRYNKELLHFALFRTAVQI